LQFLCLRELNASLPFNLFIYYSVNDEVRWFAGQARIQKMPVGDDSSGGTKQAGVWEPP
jgi:hypothetical protein